MAGKVSGHALVQFDRVPGDSSRTQGRLESLPDGEWVKAHFEPLIARRKFTL